LEGADHFSNTLFYDHKLTLYEAILSYLSGECGLVRSVAVAQH